MPTSTPTILPTRSSNPFEAARLSLIQRLLKMPAPGAYPSYPSPADHEGIAHHIREAAQIFDEWLASIGAEVRDNATTHVSSEMFSGTFLAAVDGNETWACELQGMDVAEERRALRRAS